MSWFSVGTDFTILWQMRLVECYSGQNSNYTLVHQSIINHCTMMCCFMQPFQKVVTSVPADCHSGQSSCRPSVASPDTISLYTLS